MGFDAKSAPVASGEMRHFVWQETPSILLPPITIYGHITLDSTPSRYFVLQEIVERSSKLITFIDLGGHERYLKTTMFGLTGHRHTPSLPHRSRSTRL